jgi:ADP-ribosyl-[dinitrogen reductase] hydrolase
MSDRELLRSRPDIGDRAAGALLGLAVGDALGAPYEGGRTPPDELEMVGSAPGEGPGSGWAPGEWTDDTCLAVCIAEVTATGTLDPVAIGRRFLDWFEEHGKGIGSGTRGVLSRSRSAPQDLPRHAADWLREHPRGGAGNGSLMRTAPVALANLGDDAAIARDARSISDLTHADELAGDACVLWSVAIDRAVREQRLHGIRDGLVHLPRERASWWGQRLDEAERREPSTFVPNGYVVTALQAAHAAIHQTAIPDVRPARHLQDALTTAVHIGDDTDTVAAIAGQLLGARWGATAVPFGWRRPLHGWPGMRAGDLVRLAQLTVSGGRPADDGWPLAPMLSGYRAGQEPFLSELPGDPGLLLGNLASLPDALDLVDAVVSLCRVGAEDVPPHLEHHEVLLTDRADATANLNLDVVIDDTVAAITTLREEGKRVFLHCVAGRSRMPTVAAAYLAAREEIDGLEAFAHIARVIPHPDTHNLAFQELLAAKRSPDRGG